MAGTDLAYMGARFIATREAAVDQAYRKMLVTARANDILVTRGVSGTPAAFLKPSLLGHGLDLDDMATRTTPVTSIDGRLLKPWKDIWSAGQGVGAIVDAPPVADLIDRLRAEYDAAIAAFQSAEG